ncbi:MAG: hypothetical protein AB7R40_23630 [Nitrospiraceae bacterium]
MMEWLKWAATAYVDFIEYHAVMVSMLWPASLLILAYVMWG